MNPHFILPPHLATNMISECKQLLTYYDINNTWPGHKLLWCHNGRIVPTSYCDVTMDGLFPCHFYGCFLITMVLRSVSSPPILRYSYFKIWPWKSMVKVMCVVKGQGHVWPSKFKSLGYGQGQTHWSHLRPGGQSICLLFVSWQSDHFWLRYSKIHIWPWKI